MRARPSAAGLLGALVVTLGVSALAAGDSRGLSRQDRDLARQMLESVEGLVERTYYDRTYHGIDIAARFKVAATMIDRAASLAQAYTSIAQALMALGDSHTFFVPPARPGTYENGWDMQMVGDECVVAAVNPTSDAAGKGLRPGDRLLQIEGFVPSRAELWKLQYAYSALAPRPVLTVVAQSPGAQPRTIALGARVTRGPSTVGRGAMKPLRPRTRRHAFGGRIVVLIDAASASASELLARALQIEKRAVVIGDRSAGSVREARMVPLVVQKGPGLILYAASVTDADLVMTDGGSLEGVGVQPDILLLPTPDDLAHGRDPVLARAAAMLDAPLDSTDAGALFPVQWK